MNWVTGPEKMEEDVELEEGEAGYFKSDDDRTIDPDIALSYIDEKLQSLLGHFQKDFEGGVSAENLGAKFGGYGSFLPMYQRSPPIWSQPKSPERVQTNINQSPGHLHREGAARSSSSIPDATLCQRDGTAAPHIMHSLMDEKVSLGNDLVRKNFDLPSEQVAEKLPLRRQPSPNKPLNKTDQKSLKFRIKVCSDKAEPKNVAIYSGLGLISPSSSPGNSPGESGGIPYESREENANKSPMRILQMLSALSVALGPILSPLPDRFVNLLRDIPMEGKSMSALKDKPDHSGRLGDDCNSEVGDQDVLEEKKINAIGKCESAKENAILLRIKETSGAEVLDSRQCSSFDESQKLQFDSVENNAGSLRNSFKELDKPKDPEKGTLMKNRKLNKGRLLGADVVKNNPLELVPGQDGNKFKHQEVRNGSVEKIMTKDSPLKFPESRSNKANRITFSSRIGSDISESDKDSKGATEHSLQKDGFGVASDEQDKLRMLGCRKKIPSESKKKSNISQVNGKVPSDSAGDARSTGLSPGRKEKRGSKKNASKARDLYEDLFGNSEATVCPVDSFEKPSSDGSKCSIDTVKDEVVHRDRLKVKSSRNKVNTVQTFEPVVKDPLNCSMPPSNGLQLEMGQTTGALETESTSVAPVYIEDWVCCDRCQKWRLLPYGRKPDQLPEKWVCTMLDWLPGMNHCDIIEDETTKALQALYLLPLPDNQHNSQYHSDRVVTGVSLVDAHHSYLGNPNVSANNIANGGKNKHKVKETNHKGGRPILEMTSAARNVEQGPMKWEILNDKEQLGSKTRPISTSIGQHRSSSDNAVEKYSNNHKLEHLNQGEGKMMRNSKRVSSQFEHPVAKKVKTGHTSDIIDSPNSGGSLGRTEFYSTTLLPGASTKVKQKSTGRSSSKDAKFEEGIVLQPSGRKLKEDMRDTIAGESFDARHSSDGHMSLKKRKLMDWQNSQSNVEALKIDGHPLADDKVPVDENCDGGVRGHKKPMVLQTDGNLFTRTKANDEKLQKDTKNRMLSSVVKDSRIDKGFDKEKQFREFKIKVASQLTVEDLESLKKDLALEQLSAAATSSSSKVSDSRKTRAHYSESRGSPVESVSSSPLKTSVIEKLSPLEKGSLSHHDVKAGDFHTAAKAKTKKPPGTGHPKSFNNSELDFQESEGIGSLVGNCEVGLRPSVCGNGCLEGSPPGTLEGHRPCLTDEPHSEPYYDKDQSNKKDYTVSIDQKKGKAPFMLPKDKERSSDPNHKKPHERVSPPRDRQRTSNPKKSSRVVAEVNKSQVATSAEELGDVNHRKSTSRSVKSNKVINRASKKAVDDAGESRLKVIHSGIADASVQNQRLINQEFQSEKLRKIFPVVDGGEKPQVNQHPQDKHDLPPMAIVATSEDRKKNRLVAQPHDVSELREMSRESKDFGNGIHKSESLQTSAHAAADGLAARNPSGPSFLRNNASVQSASDVLKEAENFRDYADRLKDTGFGYECNETYFQAALKFLQGASLLERTNESSKSGEMKEMQIYVSSAKLCETCAEEYERRQEMAAAALAYKCMEVAYMRVVYCKNITVNRVWNDLQASLQMVPQGESPSSSASDIDNLNNQALVEKSSLSKIIGATHAGNHIIASRSRPSIARLLDFTKDVNCAMEASRKSQNALAAANAIIDEVQNEEGIVSVKRVIDFSFQDVEQLVRLVGLAKEAINREAFRGNRN